MLSCGSRHLVQRASEFVSCVPAVRGKLHAHPRWRGGSFSRIRDLDTIELSDDDEDDDVEPRSVGVQGFTEIQKAHGVAVVLPSALASTSPKESSQLTAVSDVGCLAVPVPCTSALAESSVAVTQNVGMQEPGTGSSVVSGHSPDAACVRGFLDTPVFASEAAPSLPESAVVAGRPAKRRRTRWGRCTVAACQAPLRLWRDAAEGRPFLGCSSWTCHPSCVSNESP